MKRQSRRPISAPYLTRIEGPPPKRQFVRILLSPKIEYLLYKPPYLTGIEGPPPKRMLYTRQWHPFFQNFISASVAQQDRASAS